MHTKVAIVSSWLFIGLGIFVGLKFSPFFSLLALIAAVATRRFARLPFPSRLHDERAGIAIVVILLCMWIDLLFHVQHWLRLFAQAAFSVLLIVGVAFAAFCDLKLLISPTQKKTA